LSDQSEEILKIEEYIDRIRNGYYEASYLHKIIDPIFSSDPSSNYKELKIEGINFAMRNLKSRGHRYIKLEEIGYKLADSEIAILTKEIEKITTIERIAELSPLSLAQIMIPINRPYHLLVPRQLYSHLKTSHEWQVQYNAKKERDEIKLTSPPAGFYCLPKNTHNKMYVIDQFLSQVRYYSVDNSPEGRFELYRRQKGLSIEVSCIVSLNVELDQNSRSSVYLLSEELLKSFQK